MPEPVPEPLFSVFKFGEEDDTCLYGVTRLGVPSLSFTVVLSRTQAVSAKPSDIEAIREWCQHHLRNLPPEGSSIRIHVRHS